MSTNGPSPPASENDLYTNVPDPVEDRLSTSPSTSIGRPGPIISKRSHRTILHPSEDIKARLPRVPRRTHECPRPLTSELMNDWTALWHEKTKQRRPTMSEGDDMMEILQERNIEYVESASETSCDGDLEEQECYMDQCQMRIQRKSTVWTPEYEARREARKQAKRILSPPPTPPHLTGLPLPRTQTSLSTHQPSSPARVQKSKGHKKASLRYPVTRSRGDIGISLRHRKG